MKSKDWRVLFLVAGEDLHSKRSEGRAVRSSEGLHTGIRRAEQQREALGTQNAPLLRQEFGGGFELGSLDIEVPSTTSSSFCRTMHRSEKTEPSRLT